MGHSVGGLGAWGLGESEGPRAGGPGGQWERETGVLGPEESGGQGARGAGGLGSCGGQGFRDSWVAAKGQGHGRGLVIGA